VLVITIPSVDVYEFAALNVDNDTVAMMAVLSVDADAATCTGYVSVVE
jgi:hypothetical protein